MSRPKTPHRAYQDALSQLSMRALIWRFSQQLFERHPTEALGKNLQRATKRLATACDRFDHARCFLIKWQTEIDTRKGGK